jgi:hypothetical protein
VLRVSINSLEDGRAKRYTWCPLLHKIRATMWSPAMKTMAEAWSSVCAQERWILTHYSPGEARLYGPGK